MTPFLKLLSIFRGRTPIPPKLAEAMASSPDLADLIAAGQEMGAAPAFNWAAIIALIMQLLPVILPLL